MESACVEYLFERGWPNGLACRGCGEGRAWRLKTKAFTYECVDCRPRREGRERGTKTRSRVQGRTAGVVFGSSRLLLMIDEGGF
jgi:hypothetical protein